VGIEVVVIVVDVVDVPAWTDVDLGVLVHGHGHLDVDDWG